ncbi:hypothetical protein BSL82_11880 [Tardibacter chloracetimidivorans]|uniref:Acyl-CoA dehydrogenase n=2 Tax=Tardibacter chloracetimidivorans TaxID=1921510 RepID=A0A1L3ZZQ2_9SPHN|nr:hypothetical protein BSL82_11880 [Tardibacter chloracetimidivorans]
MNFALTEEHEMLRDAAARLFQAESSAARVRAAEDRGFDPALYRALGEFGAFALRQAGGGGTLLEASLISEELGRSLGSVPFAEAIVATRLLSLLPGEAAAAWLARVDDGALVTLVTDPTPSRRRMANGGMAADGILLLENGRIVIASGAAERFGENLAFGSSLAWVGDGGENVVLAEGAEAVSAYEAVLEEWKILQASMLNGLARRALELAAEYATERHAFGRAIGSYQGIAHPLADAISEVEGAQLLLRKAIWAHARGRDDAGALTSMAYWWATQAAARATAKSLHTFGGYGVSLEYDIQLYYRRAKAWSLLAGDPRQELLRAGRRLWLGEAAQRIDAGEVTLEFSFGEEAETHAARVRRFFEDNLTPELRAKAHHSVAGYDAGLHRKLAAEGLLFPHWPREAGGSGQSLYDYYAGIEQFSLQGWEHMTGPITNSVGDIVHRFATTDAHRRAVREMADGDALGCLGFSEPSGGSDIFAAKTRADRDGDGNWIINGSKIFTTSANLAKYCFLLARTDPAKAKHAGLTIFLVPLDAPGVDIQAVETLQDERTNIVYLSDVRISDDCRIGEVDGALSVMAAMLKTEHGSGDQYRHGHALMLRVAAAWAKDAERDGRPLLEDSDAIARLAMATTHGEVSKVLCHRAIWMMAEDIDNRYWGPMAKVFATEIFNRDSLDLMDLAAPESLAAGHSGLGGVEIGYRQSIGTTIYGGTSEVQRSLIAEQALALPKSRS